MMHVGFMVLIEDCHNHCVFCDASRLGAGRLLTLEQARAQVRHYAAQGVRELVVSGGEPLHHPDLLTVVAEARSRGIGFVSLYTTAAFNLSRHHARDLREAGVDIAMVSLFGPDARTHDAVARSAGAFAQTTAGLEALSQAGVRFCLNTPVMRANYRRLEEMLRIAAGSGAVSWQLSDIHPTTAVLANSNVHVPYPEVRPVLDAVFSRADALGLQMMTQEFPLCVLGEHFARSQEMCRAWYTALVTEARFASGEYEVVPPITARARHFAPQCTGCSYRAYCRGIPDSYRSRIADDSFWPIQAKAPDEVARNAAADWLRRMRLSVLR